MQWLVLVSILAVASSRPQQYNVDKPEVILTPDGAANAKTENIKNEQKQEAPPKNTIELQTNKTNLATTQEESRQLLDSTYWRQVKEPSPIDESTKEILKKIEEVNEKHGLRQKKKPSSYHHFPFGYFRSDFQRDGFKFPRDPYTNPILEYIENQKASARAPSVPDDEPVPAGHYIKRKIVHHQTFFVPVNPSLTAQTSSYYPMMPTVRTQNATQQELEKETVNNVKAIMGTSQIYPQSYGLIPGDYRLYGPGQQETPQLRQIQLPPWPLAQYFPIVIKDPIMQMMNAFTSMIEYGPQAGNPASCKKPSKNKGNSEKMKSRANDDDMLYSITDTESNPELTVSNNEGEDAKSETILDIEDLTITDQSKEMKFNLNLRQGRDVNSGDEIRKTFTYNPSKKGSDSLTYPFIQSLEVKKEQIRNEPSPPIRDQVIHDDELDDDYKADDIHVTNDGNKKLFSKDNTGSGIFVHKIKVRKGGVAIAGPGGIATAGSGGTAIVGPNGFAYTQPNSLAIAGSGSKVIAVDPNIDLIDLVNSNTTTNVTNNNNERPGRPGLPTRPSRPPRVGKVVAVGPVIYYNRG